MIDRPATSHQASGTVADLTERELIARVRQHLPPAPDWVVVGIGDDAAVVRPERNRLEVLSVDALVEAVHFDRAFTPMDAIGHRALAVNLSDLAAMGATPRLALLSLALPARLSVDEFDAMVSGIATLGSHYRMHIVGGNLTRSPGPLVLDVTVTGGVKPRQTLTRSGARPGDELYVTGMIGAAAAGLQMLQARQPVCPTTEGCILRYLYPEPRVRIGSLLARNRAATACIDLSDGLADGVHQIARSSGVGATVDADALPIEPAAREWFEKHGGDVTTQAATGGDDYELLFTVRPRTHSRLRAAIQHGDAPLTRIGICTAEPAVLLREDGEERPLPEGYTHFR